MTNDTDKTTRRQLLQSAALSTGLFLGGEQIASAQRGWSGQGRAGQGRVGAPLPILTDNPSIVHYARNCRKCGHCRTFCRDVTTVFDHVVPAREDACIHCGQCTTFCKRFAIQERYHYRDVVAAIADPDAVVVASTSPAIRVALGEMFRLSPGTNVEGKTVAALRKLGVDRVLDTTFAADLAVVEEAAELCRRLEEKQPLPMFTSCCPAWVRFVKLFYPKLLPNLSTVKSPVLMQGAMVKTYYAQKLGLDPARIVHVALTPCTAKKAEILLPAAASFGSDTMRDVDVSLTTRELGYLLQEAKVDLAGATDSAYDLLMGSGSGAGMIFGNTGGVMEASLRTAYKKLNGENPPQDFYRLEAVRGLDSVRQATVDLGKRKLRVAVVHGIGKARPLLETIQSGRGEFDFVEVMACPGGCVGGGGQPLSRQTDPMRVKQIRSGTLYQHDTKQTVRLSCDNPDLQKAYDEFLGEPLGEMSEKLLHVAKR